MTFYQNQLNFAVWCVSSGCGVSVEHLNTSQNLLLSVYKFHMCYQVRRILQQMSCPLPGESLFNTADNHINLIAYKKICNKFDVDSNTDFRFKGGNSGGLGTMYNYATRMGYMPLTGKPYDPSRFQFIPQSTNTVIKIDYISQSEAADGWVQFILEKSLGFTRQQNFVDLLESNIKSLFSLLLLQNPTDLLLLLQNPKDLCLHFRLSLYCHRQ